MSGTFEGGVQKEIPQQNEALRWHQRPFKNSFKRGIKWLFFKQTR